MTLIVVHRHKGGVYAAADGNAVSGTILVSKTYQKIRRFGSYHIAFCGSTAILRYLEKVDPKDPVGSLLTAFSYDDELYGQFIIFSRDRLVTVDNFGSHIQYGKEVKTFCAGSGRDFAYGYLNAFKKIAPRNIRKAFDVANKYDLAIGPCTQFINLRNRR